MCTYRVRQSLVCESTWLLRSQKNVCALNKKISMCWSSSIAFFCLARCLHVYRLLCVYLHSVQSGLQRLKLGLQCWTFLVVSDLICMLIALTVSVCKMVMCLSLKHSEAEQVLVWSWILGCQRKVRPCQRSVTGQWRLSIANGQRLCVKNGLLLVSHLEGS